MSWEGGKEAAKHCYLHSLKDAPGQVATILKKVWSTWEGYPPVSEIKQTSKEFLEVVARLRVCLSSQGSKRRKTGMAWWGGKLG